MSKVSLSELDPIVNEASERFGVPKEYIWNVIRAENSGSVKEAGGLKEVPTDALSRKKAFGVMQVTPIALEDNIKNGLIAPGTDYKSLNVRDQVMNGTAYLSTLLKLSKDPREVYAMYNYGPKARFRMDQLPAETSLYTQKATGTSMAEPTGTPAKPSETGMGTPDLIQALLNITTQQNANIQAGQADSEKLMARSREMSAGAFDQQRTAIDQQEQIAGGVANVNYQSAQLVQQLQTLMGMSPEQADNEIATSLAAVSQARAARAPVRAEYDKLASTDLMTNPIGYLFAQLQLPSVAAKNNALADQEDLALQNIQTRTAMLANAKSTITANTADAVRELELQKATVEAENARSKLTLAEAQNIAGSAQSRMQAMQVANMIGDNTRNTLVAIAGMEDREKALELREEQREQILAGKALATEEKNRFNLRAKVISDALGWVEPMTYDRLRTLASKDLQEAWSQAVGNGVMGSTLENSLEFFRQANVAGLRQKGGASIVGTAEKLYNTGAQYQGGVERTALATGGKKPSLKEARSKGFEIYMDEVIASMKGSDASNVNDLANSKWDSTYNPYVLPFVGFNKAIDSAPQLAFLKNNEVAKTVRDLMAAGVVTKENLTSDQQKQVLLAVSKKVSDRSITPKKAAADIAEYFKAGTAYNQAFSKYDLFTLPPQTSYVFTIPSETMTGNQKKVDLMNAALVEQALVWRAQKGFLGTDAKMFDFLPVSPKSLERLNTLGEAAVRSIK